MSIVIVGVGSANFGTMNFLDADGSLLKDKYGKKAEADIVQVLIVCCALATLMGAVCALPRLPGPGHVEARRCRVRTH